MAVIYKDSLTHSLATHKVFLNITEFRPVSGRGKGSVIKQMMETCS